LDDETEAIDPSEQAAFNVTQVEFADDRVYYLNTASDPADPFDSITWVVAGTVEGGVLAEKTSIAVAGDDFDHERVDWDMVNIEGSIFAILRNTWDTTSSDEVARTSRLSIVDAPEGNEPRLVLGVPTTAPVESIALDEGRL